jgi:general secretion pathway protein D
MRLAETTVVLLAIMAACSSTLAQEGLAGDLDRLGKDFGIKFTVGDAANDKPAADAAKGNDDDFWADFGNEKKPEEKAKDEQPKAAEEAKEAVAEAAPAAAEEVKEAVAEAAPAAVEEAKEAVAEAAPVAVEEAKEAVAEAAPAAEEKAKDDLNDLLAPAEEPKAEEKAKEAVAEAAPAAAEEAKEAVAEAAPVAAEKAKDDLNDLLEPVAEEPKAEEKPAEVAPAVAAKADDDEEEVAEVIEDKKDEPAAVAEPEVAEVKPEEPVVAEPVVAEAAPAEAAPAEAAPAEAAPAEDVDDYAALVDEIATLERVRKQALEKHGKASLESARKEMKDGNYAEAQRLYEEAVKFITKRPGNEKIIDEAEEGVAESIYRQAVVLWKKEVMDEALQMARKAREKNHPKASQLISDIQAQIDNPPKPPRPKAVKRWKEKSYVENDEDMRIRLGKAREYYLTGEYDLARRELEIILRGNPYNQEAVVMLKRVAEREYDFSSGELNTTRASMIADVRDKWTARNLYAINVPNQDKVGPVTVEGTTISDPSGKTAEEVTADKMRSIEIPSINFRQANINDVIDFLQQASRDYDDPQLPPEKRGVNLILKLGAPTTSSTTIESDDPFAQAGESASSGGVPPVTFKATSMNLFEVLQVITDISGLKFRIRGNIVMIMPQDMPTEDMVSKTYTVLPSIEERASGIAASLSASKTDSGGFPDPSEMNTDTSTGVDWKQLFADMGVKWPTGSTITYLPSINKMRVYNTPENLVEFDKALQELNVTPRQVEIEARFVEVGQSDLDSLGIEWGLTDPWELAQNRNDPMQYISVDKVGSGAALRTLNTAEESFNGMNSRDDGILKIASHLTNPEIEMILHMISQKSNTDLLSAPKVVTMNSQEAIIKVVTEYIYPTEYELEEYEGASGDSDNVQNVYPAVQPSSFEMREVGVILQVAPEVSEDGQMIYLQLNPQIISEPEWVDYGFEYPKGTLNADGEMDTYHIAMRQPLFKVRSINTKVAIYNGATVVMGGMITEARREVEDKIPFLGDIPLIGRLFRSTYEESDKRNLLIFVTARMVDPAGRTVNNESADVEAR